MQLVVTVEAAEAVAAAAAAAAVVVIRIATQITIIELAEVVKNVHCVIVPKRYKDFIRCLIASISRAARVWKAIWQLRYSNRGRKLRVHNVRMQCIRATLKHCYAHRPPLWRNTKTLWSDAFCSPIQTADGVQRRIAGWTFKWSITLRILKFPFLTNL